MPPKLSDIEKITAPEKKVATKETATVKDIGSVYVEKGYTQNLGEYNSARVSVGVTLPISPTEEQLAEAKATIKIAIEIVDKQLEQQLKELRD